MGQRKRLHKKIIYYPKLYWYHQSADERRRGLERAYFFNLPTWRCHFCLTYQTPFRTSQKSSLLSYKRQSGCVCVSGCMCVYMCVWCVCDVCMYVCMYVFVCGVCVCVCVCTVSPFCANRTECVKYAGRVKYRIWMFKQLLHLVPTVLQRIKKSLCIIALFKGAFLSNLNNWEEAWPVIQCAVQWSGLECQPNYDQTEHGRSPVERTVCPLLTAPCTSLE